MARIDELDRAIRDADSRMKTVSINVEALNKEIASLITLKATLEDNISCLKAKQVITIAQEFKKAKDDLGKTKHRLSTLSNDREHFVKVFNDLKSWIVIANQEIAKLNKAADENVLTFKGKNNGQR